MPPHKQKLELKPDKGIVQLLQTLPYANVCHRPTCSGPASEPIKTIRNHIYIYIYIYIRPSTCAVLPLEKTYYRGAPQPAMQSCIQFSTSTHKSGKQWSSNQLLLEGHGQHCLFPQEHMRKTKSAASFCGIFEKRCEDSLCQNQSHQQRPPCSKTMSHGNLVSVPVLCLM